MEFCKRLNLALNCASFSESEQVTEKSTMTFRYTTKLKQEGCHAFFKKRKPWIIQRPTRRYIAKMPKVVRNVNTHTKKIHSFREHQLALGFRITSNPTGVKHSCYSAGSSSSLTVPPLLALTVTLSYNYGDVTAPVCLGAATRSFG